MTFGELGERMDAAEIRGWIAFDEIEQTPSWLQTATLCRTILGLLGEPPPLDAFMPVKAPIAGPKPDAPDPDPGLELKIRAWALTRGGILAPQGAP